MRKWRWLVGLLMGLGCFTGILTAQASVNHFSVQAIQSKNQLDSKVGYFDLLVKPGRVQPVAIKINNDDKIAHQYEVQTTLATTSDDGDLIYSERSGYKPDQSLQFNVATATSKSGTVRVAAKKTAIVNLEVKVPKRPFPGIALGGITIVQKATANKQKGLSIQNQFAYSLGLQLRENKRKVAPKLNLLTVKPVQQQYQQLVLAKLQNSRAAIMNDLKVTSYVTRVGSTKQLFKTTKSKMRMAPNSNFNFALGNGKETLAAGKYQLHLWATARDGAHWQFTKPFTVSKRAAASVKAAPDQVQSPTNWKLISVLVGIIVILVGLLVWMIFRNRRRQA